MASLLLMMDGWMDAQPRRPSGLCGGSPVIQPGLLLYSTVTLCKGGRNSDPFRTANSTLGSMLLSSSKGIEFICLFVLCLF